MLLDLLLTIYSQTFWTFRDVFKTLPDAMLVPLCLVLLVAGTAMSGRCEDWVDSTGEAHEGFDCPHLEPPLEGKSRYCCRVGNARYCCAGAEFDLLQGPHNDHAFGPSGGSGQAGDSNPLLAVSIVVPTIVVLLCLLLCCMYLIRRRLGRPGYGGGHHAPLTLSAPPFNALVASMPPMKQPGAQVLNHEMTHLNSSQC